jgi:hypothetical protein
MASKNNKTNVGEMLTKRTGGIKKYLTDPTVAIPINGKQCHPADVLAIFQADVDARAGVDNAHASVKASITARKTADANRRAADAALKSYVVQLYGATSVEAQEFGYPPPKSGTKSVATKQAAIEKSAATRAARGTIGSAQKAEISGTTIVFSSPEAAAAAAAHSVAPAAGAPVVQPAPAGDATAVAAKAATAAPAPAAATPAVNGAGAGNGASGASHQ